MDTPENELSVPSENELSVPSENELSVPSENELSVPSADPAPLFRAATETHLSLPEGLTYEQWRDQYGRPLQKAKSGLCWWLGDWLKYGEDHFGDAYAQVLADTDYEDQTLRDAKWVAGKIPPCRRRIELSWSHHREVASLSPVAADRMLELAIQHKWTRDALRQHVRGLTREAAAISYKDETGVSEAPPTVIMERVTVESVLSVCRQHLAREERLALYEMLREEFEVEGEGLRSSAVVQEGK